MATLKTHINQCKNPGLELSTLRALRDREASLYIGMSQSWLRHIRIEGARLDHVSGPRFIKIGRSVRYLREDLDNWLEKFQKWDTLAQRNIEHIKF